MKALILAAGFGTRLRPCSRIVPKPLFPLGGKPLLDRIIDRLLAAGCDELAINTHHLADRIESHIRSRSFPIPVHLHHEPEILGTGGSIGYAARRWPQAPLLVVNGDILTDIDFKAVHAFHQSHAHPVTMVMHDDVRFNTVRVDREGFVTNFYPYTNGREASGPCSGSHRQMAFTGIHVIDPGVTAACPAGAFIHIIDVYRELVRRGGRIATFPVTGHLWDDIGTPEQYRDAVIRLLAPEAFSRSRDEQREYTDGVEGPCIIEPVAGDGSDRGWLRLSRQGQTLIVADHGIQTDETVTEFDSFVYIGEFLHARGVPTPRIHLSDRFSGLVFLEDMGDDHLQTVVRRAGDEKTVVKMYEKAIDLLVAMSLAGREGFEASRCYQTPVYDRQLILSKEIRYFIDHFLNGCAGVDPVFEEGAAEYEHIIENALSHGFPGFMHRDFQSRNIMIRNERPCVIDFQGGRIGPMQYDLASLLIDPYANLPVRLQERLLDVCVHKVQAVADIRPANFVASYRPCALTRNMQILGAFGYLSRVRDKPRFARYIPRALKTLDANLEKAKTEDRDYPMLRSWVRQASARIRKG